MRRPTTILRRKPRRRRDRLAARLHAARDDARRRLKRLRQTAR